MQTHGLVITRHPEVYDTSDDTILLADNLVVNTDEKVLEVGSGSGYISLVAAQRAKCVVGVDINPHAVKLSKLNAKLNNLLNVEFVLGDLFSPICGKFNVVLMNPPYLQGMSSKNRGYIDYSWNGGEDGRSVTDRFLSEVGGYLETSGRILIVQSSLSGHSKTIQKLFEEGFKARIIAQKNLFFETLYLLEATEMKHSAFA